QIIPLGEATPYVDNFQAAFNRQNGVGVPPTDEGQITFSATTTPYVDNFQAAFNHQNGGGVPPTDEGSIASDNSVVRNG
ncbi:unnamed protein product, partial [Adineta steineri]